ncbi:hypothetical protein HYFRA_00005724 [Hymenoscyphus fraxineus]|uniref:Uncharacterized protein n=1 Tax=Hymenoscyphus fraxineus TaxID=746836 RepID=A0A9N9PGM1_9HELO|nr:hypothetical protein HYFRA_00005724 [Hymenoscyphus fraxineus]
MHILADLTCNLGVIIAAVIIMQLTTDNRYYADAGASIGIGILIVAFAARLAKTNWEILHQCQGSGLGSSNGGSELDEHVDERGGNEDSPSDAGDGTVEEEGEEREDENPWSEDQDDEQEPESREDNEFGNGDQYGLDAPTHNPTEEYEPGDGNADEFQDYFQGEQEPDNTFNSEEEHEDPAETYNDENGEQEPENEDSWDEIPIEDTDTVNPQGEDAEPSEDQNLSEEIIEEPGYRESNETSSDLNSWNNTEGSEQVTCEEIPSDPCIESTPDNEEQKQALQALQAGENNGLGSEGDGVANLIKRAKMALIF